MGKIIGFLEIEHHDRNYARAASPPQLCPFYPGCIINLSGYDFRKGQGIIPAL